MITYAFLSPRTNEREFFATKIHDIGGAPAFFEDLGATLAELGEGSDDEEVLKAATISEQAKETRTFLDKDATEEKKEAALEAPQSTVRMVGPRVCIIIG